MIQITVKNTYFTNFAKCVESLNAFFQSEYKTKNFPMLDEDDVEVEPTILGILKWMESIDPTWIDDTSKIEDALQEIHKALDEITSEDADTDNEFSLEPETQSLIDSFVGYKMLQFMSEHKSGIEELFEGIYSLELFTTPSKYANVINTFSEPISLNELGENIVNMLTGDEGYKLFDVSTYVKGVLHSEYINAPNVLKPEIEIERIKKSKDRTDVEIVIDDRTNDDEVTTEAYLIERAEINFFEETNPPHIRYHEDSKKWQISKQFTAAITRLLAGLKTCDTVEDIEEFINTNANKINPDDYTCMVLPVILARVFDNPKKFTNRVFDDKALKKYTDSYASIMKQNNGAKRFKNYDLFTVFKTDKEGTLQFLEDFLTLRLASDPNAYVKNHELLILFNIFDSRIYFDILYNVMPQSVRENEWKNEDNFVKSIRARLNANSRKSNPYDQATKKPIDQTVNNEVQNMTDVTEYVYNYIDKRTDMTISEMHLCEEFLDVVHQEINTLGDRFYNEGYSPLEVLQFIQEVKPAVNGELPDYMRTRMQVDSPGDSSDAETEVEDAPVPDGIPENPIDELADSVETRANVFGQDGKDMDDAFGKDADVDPVDPSKPHKHGQIVYNITYNNSFNRTTNDMSENKTIRKNSHDIKNSTIKGGINNTPSNSNNNGTPSATNTSSNVKSEDTKNDDSTFSTGKTIQEVFSFLYNEEPLFVKEDANTNNRPKPDLLTTAMDVDRKSLAKQQEAKKKLNTGVSIGKAVVRPFDRAKTWLTRFVDNLIKQDDDKVKQELLDSPSYRSSVFTASRWAMKLGAVAFAYALNPYMGFMATVALGKREYDANTRLRKEVQEEFVTEIEILNDRIEKLDHKASYARTPEQKKAALQEKYRLMRLRVKMQNQAAAVTKSPIVKAKNVN